MVDKVRKLVEESTGINGAHVIVGATDNHTGAIIPSDSSSIDIGVDPKSKGGLILALYNAKLPGHLSG